MPHTTSTPAPWHVNDAIRGKLYIESAKGFVADMQYEEATDYTRERCKRDAHLIAAAPEMLEACKLALSAFEGGHAIDWNILSAAIAKAEGRQP